MNIEHVEFPREVQKNLCRRLKTSIKVTCFEGTVLDPIQFNFTVVEPFKMLFQNKRKTKHIIVYVLQSIVDEKCKYQFFVNSISEENKKSMTAIAQLINDLL